MAEKYSNLPKCNNAHYCKYSKDGIVSILKMVFIVMVVKKL